MSAIIAPLTPSTGGTPAGSTTQVQFNDAGDFGGDAGLVYDKTTDALTVAGSVTSVLFRSASSGNVVFVASPSGTGAFQLQVADSTATGGNARGANSIDLQTTRSAATAVASGTASFAAGQNNTASGTFSVAIGVGNSASATAGSAMGNGNTSSGNNAVSMGSGNTASGAGSVAVGIGANTRSIDTFFALGSNTAARQQTGLFGIAVATTDATPTILRSNGNAAGTANQLTLANNSALAFTGLVVANVTGGGNSSSWEIKGFIKRGANAGTTAFVGTPSVTLISQDAGASGWSIALTANTTNGCLTVTVTGQAATTIRWNCSLFSSEVSF